MEVEWIDNEQHRANDGTLGNTSVQEGARDKRTQKVNKRENVERKLGDMVSYGERDECFTKELFRDAKC